jgi:cytoskeletal protein CcmA (bactofilin family)
MFRKREPKTEDIKVDNYEKDSVDDVSKQKINTILKGSKLTGDINISYDLELSGEVEGNISSEQNSNIVIQGVCKGNIRTREGNVTIEGELINGDIIAGGDVKITGKFNGGMVKVKGKIYVNGEFKGKLEGNEIEIGPDARGKGEVFYNEYISVSRGAKVEVQISQTQEALKEIKKPADTKIVNIDRTSKEMGGLK